MAEKIRTIDMTPTWEGILPVILYGLENGPAHNRDNLKEELRRMAEAADKWNAHCKEQNAQENDNAHQAD